MINTLYTGRSIEFQTIYTASSIHGDILTRAVNKLWNGRPGTLFKIKYLGDFLLVFLQIFQKDACKHAKYFCEFSCQNTLCEKS